MKRVLILIFVVVLSVGTFAAQGQRGQRGEGRPAGPPMDSTPKMFNTADYKIRVVTVAEGLAYPYSLTFLPDGSALVSESNGHLRMIRGGKLLPEPVAQIPNVHFVAGRGGFMELVQHPNFAQNHLIYFTYDKEGEKGATQAVARGTLEGNKLTAIKDVFVADNWGKADGHLSARINFGRDGMLYVAISDHNVPANVALGTSHAGKVVRMKDDGTLPTSGPFGNGYRPEIYATGFRDPHAILPIPGTDDFWEVEHGDELNRVKAGGNYGWPFVTSGEGNPIGPPPAGSKMTEPYLKQWPVFHFSGITFYNGDKFPKWKGNVFIGCLETQEVHRVVVGKDAPAGRETLFKDLGQRVRSVKEGPDGFIYFTTDDPAGRVMRIEPAS
jgi:glucose/arabinose dehydrogenase